MSENNQNLFFLDELSNYKVATNYSDVRGWEVTDAENRTIGKVEHLLVNKIAERVVYLDIEVDQTLIEDGYNTFQLKASDGVHGFLNKEGDNHLIIPIGMVSLNEELKRVHTSQINYDTFTQARRFNKDAIIAREYELMLLRHYRGGISLETDENDESFYNSKEFDKTF